MSNSDSISVVYRSSVFRAKWTYHVLGYFTVEEILPHMTGLVWVYYILLQNPLSSYHTDIPAVNVGEEGVKYL